MPFPDTDLARSPDERVLPRFEGRSILNLVTTLTAALGLPPVAAPYAAAPFSAPLPLDGVSRVVLFVVDGLGHYLLSRYAQGGQMPLTAARLHRGELGYTTATSVLPSSTMIALTTLHTGVPPAAHGWLGTSIHAGGTVVDVLRQTDLLTDRPFAHPERLLSVPSIYRRLSDAGIPSAYVNPQEYEGQFLDGFYFDGSAPFRYSASGHDAGAPLPQQVRAALDAGARYVMAYWPYYDSNNHAHGPSSASAGEAAGVVDRLLDDLLAALPQDGRTLLVVTADHGQRDMDLARRVPLPTQPPQAAYPPAGENRFRFLSGEVEGLNEYATVIPSAQFWADGLFGGPPAHPDFLQRSGEFCAVVGDRSQLTADYGFGPRSWVGAHGGWSGEEMVVPVITSRDAVDAAKM